MALLIDILEWIKAPLIITARKKNPEHSVVEFYDARNLIVNLPVDKLIDAIHAAATI